MSCSFGAFQHCRTQSASVTHQEYPLQLVLNVLHARKGSHSLDHLNENAAHPPVRNNSTSVNSSKTSSSLINAQFHGLCTHLVRTVKKTRGRLVFFLEVSGCKCRRGNLRSTDSFLCVSDQSSFSKRYRFLTASLPGSVHSGCPRGEAEMRRDIISRSHPFKARCSSIQ